MSQLRKLVIRDETLRDGLQTSGVNLTKKDKLEIVLLSAQILDNKNKSRPNNQIDLGMPEVSNFHLETIKEMATELKGSKIDLFVTGTSREKAIEKMAKSLETIPEERKIIAPFLGISYFHRKKMSLTKLQTIKEAIKMVEFAQQFCSRIHFPLEGGYYAYLEEPKFVIELLKELEELKVECIPFCDTVGTALPFSGKRVISYGQAIKEIKSYCPRLKISVHCHNDFGLAVGNALEGVIVGGAEIVDGTFLGIGERCGNTSLEALLVVLKEKGRDLGLLIEADISCIYSVSQKMAKILGIRLCQHIPVVGRNAFSHVGGIHQDGVLKDKRTYEAFRPQKIGRRGHEIVLGLLSGRKGIRYILEKKFRIKNLEDKILNKVVRRFKNLRNLKNQDPEKALLRILGQVLVRERKGD